MNVKDIYQQFFQPACANSDVFKKFLMEERNAAAKICQEQIALHVSNVNRTDKLGSPVLSKQLVDIVTQGVDHQIGLLVDQRVKDALSGLDAMVENRVNRVVETRWDKWRGHAENVIDNHFSALVEEKTTEHVDEIVRVRMDELKRKLGGLLTA